MKDAIPNLFSHWISLDIIAYLRLVSGTGNTRANWLRIMNRPNRYIKREALAPFTSDISVAQLKAYYQDKDWKNYQVLVHALKSKSLSIGAEELAEGARALEAAAREGRTDYIMEHHGEVMNSYRNLLNLLRRELQS